MPNDLAPLAPRADAAELAPLTREEVAELMADAPWPEPPSDAEMDAMYADWCARHGVDIIAADGHKDHHYWAA